MRLEARARRRLLAGVLGVVASVAAPTATPVAAQQRPIFDAHIHYSRPDWNVLTPERVLSVLARAHVFRAIVSSTPNEGTLELWRRAPRGIVPFLRPYRTAADLSTWHADPAIARLLEDGLASGIWRGIGELHLRAADAGGATVRRVVELARARGLHLHVHGDAATVEALLALEPSSRILWAHAGFESPAAVGRVLDRHPAVAVDLALRTEVSADGRLDPAWRELLVRHADRFLVGTDTWMTSRWETVVSGMRAVQEWLWELPPDVADRIAHGNGDRLFPAVVLEPRGR